MLQSNAKSHIFTKKKGGEGKGEGALSLLFPPTHILDLVCHHSSDGENIGRVTYLRYFGRWQTNSILAMLAMLQTHSFGNFSFLFVSLVTLNIAVENIRPIVLVSDFLALRE